MKAISKAFNGRSTERLIESLVDSLKILRLKGFTMNTTKQAQLAYDVLKTGSALQIPLGILWSTQVNLLVNCRESKHKKNVLESVDTPCVYVQFIRLNSNDKPCRYWGTQQCDITSVNALDRSIQMHITEQLGMKNDRNKFLQKVFCGGNNDNDFADHAVYSTPFMREMPSHIIDLVEDLSLESNDML